MNWYIAKIVFSIRSENAQVAQFDEQLRIVSARDQNEAFLKARMIGVREEDVFMSDTLRPVQWQFIDVAELRMISEIQDGMELDSCITEREDPEAYIRFLQHKANSIERSISEQSARVSVV